MKIVYIAHKLSGDIPGNIARIVSIVRFINLNMPDVVPLVPYLADVMALDDSLPEHRARGIVNDTVILSAGFIDELWICSDYETSKGVQAEIELAHKLGIPVVKPNIWTGHVN
jgi:hypothetical protein